MKNILGVLLSAMMLVVHLNAEVFTEENYEKKYSLSTDKPVNYQFKFSGLRDEKCRAIGITLYNDKNQQILSGFYDNMTEPIAIFNIPVKPGKYYLKLGGNRFIQRCYGKPFDFKLTKYTGRYEQEYNNDAENATLLTELKYTYGYIQTGGDKDYYKIIIPKKGILDFKFLHKQIQSRGQFIIQLIDSDYKKVVSFKSYLKKQKTQRLYGLKRGTYYIKVYQDSFSEKAAYLEYKMAYAFYPKTNIETIPNNTKFDASLIVDGQYIIGNFNSPQDDFYQYKAKKGNYSLVYEHKKFRKPTSISIIDSNGKYIKNISQDGLNEKEYFDFEVKQDEIIYIKFNHEFDDKESNGDGYRFGIIKAKS